MSRKYNKYGAQKNTRISWSVEELEALVNNKNSRVHLVKTNRHISLHPWYTEDVSESLHEVLGSEINQYNHEWKGFLLAYKNPQLINTMGATLYDDASIHGDIAADFYIFEPEIGCKLKGIVNKRGENHIGVLVHKAFNVSIPKRDDDEEEWRGKEFNVGQEVTFTVVHMDFKGRLPYIRGKLVPREEKSDYDVNSTPKMSNKIIFNDDGSQSENDESPNELEDVSKIESARPKFSSTVNEPSDSDENISRSIKKDYDDSCDSDEAEEKVTFNSTVADFVNNESVSPSSDSEDEKPILNESPVNLKTTSLFKEGQNDDSDDSQDQVPNEKKSKKKKSKKLLDVSESEETLLGEQTITESPAVKLEKPSKKRKRIDSEDNTSSEEAPKKIKKSKKSKKLLEDQPEDQATVDKTSATIESKPRIIHEEMLHNVDTKVGIERKNINSEKRSASKSTHSMSDSEEEDVNGESILEKAPSNTETTNLREPSPEINSEEDTADGNKNSSPTKNENEDDEDKSTGDINETVGDENVQESTKPTNSCVLDTDDSDDDFAAFMSSKKIKVERDVDENLPNSTEEPKECKKSSPVKKKSKKNSESLENERIVPEAISIDETVDTEKVKTEEKDKSKKKKSKKSESQVNGLTNGEALPNKIKREKETSISVQSSKVFNLTVEPDSDSESEIPTLPQINPEDLKVPKKEDKSSKKSKSKKSHEANNTNGVDGVEVEVKKEKDAKKKSKKHRERTEEIETLYEGEILSSRDIKDEEEISKKKKSKKKHQETDDSFTQPEPPKEKKRKSKKLSDDSGDLSDSSVTNVRIGNIRVKQEPLSDVEGSSKKRKRVSEDETSFENIRIKRELSVVKSEKNSIKTEDGAPPKKKVKTFFSE